MGLLERLLPMSAAVVKAESVTIPSWDGDVAQVASLPPGIAEAFGINTQSDNVSRREAMTVPAVRRGRQIIAGTLGTVPLIAKRQSADKGTTRIERQLLVQPDPNTTRQYTITWTVDDLLFYGISWWYVREYGADLYPLRAERIAPHRVYVDTTTGNVRIDGEPVDQKRLIRFDGPDEGILTHGARALRTYILLEEAVRKFSRMDIPLGLIEDTLGHLEKSEVQELLDSWEAARAKRSTGYLPNGLKYTNPSFNAEQVQLSQARDFQSQEIARLMNLPAHAINAPTNSSLTYATTESQRRELVDMTFAPFFSAIEHRLSMNDVTPNKTAVVFDLGKFLRGDITSVLAAAKVGIDAGILTVDEVRQDWLDLPPLNQD